MSRLTNRSEGRRPGRFPVSGRLVAGLVPAVPAFPACPVFPVFPAIRAILTVLAVTFSFLLGSCVKIPESGSRQRVLFYAAPTDLSPGSFLDPKDLETRLQRLGYRGVDQVMEQGQYKLARDRAEIFLRPFRYPGRAFAGGHIRLRFAGNNIVQVDRITPLEASDLRLEPERIAGFEGETGAVLNPLRLEDAPPLLIKALIAVEDRRFYHHPGIDPIGTARALGANLRRGGNAQGGSTLTQQLARSLFLRNQKTIFRKVREAFLALGLEMRYSKKEILEAYLNAVYWGTWGTWEIRGAREASRYYLGCELEKAETADIALLVGLIPAPNAFSPYNNPEKARTRRNLVLKILQERGILSKEEAEAAKAKPLPVRKAPIRPAEASYFLDAARAEVEARAPQGTLDKPGTVVFTTMDVKLQAAAGSAVRQGLADLEKNNRRLRRKKDPLEAATVTLDVASGEVRALVGGRDFLEYPFNRAIDAKRQPGSLFKPFVYLAAFLHPKREDGSYWTPATIVPDEPFEVRAGRKMWRPENYDRENRGEVTVRTALEQSLNVPTARVALEVGIPRVARAAKDLGIRSPLAEVPSLSLGTSEVSLLEITQAYAGFAAGGKPHAPSLLKAVFGPKGEAIPLSPLPDPPGIAPQEAYLITSLLQGVIREGTGRSARNLGLTGALAGKTGTTDEYRDAWFVGYTPRLALGVWVGFDKKDAVGLSGASAALPIWSLAMRGSESPRGDGEFTRPPDIVSVPICPESGQVATAECPGFYSEDFLEGTEPTEECPRHQDEGLFDRLHHFFGF